MTDTAASAAAASSSMDTAERVNSASATESLKKSSVLTEVQDTVSRLSAHHGVTAVLILNGKGDIVTQTGDATKTGNPKLLTRMLQAAASYVGSVHDPDDMDKNSNSSGAAAVDETSTDDAATVGSGNKIDDSIAFVRLRTSHDEILVAPKLGYTLVVFQDPTESTL
jgi:hypothetical protein